MKKKQNRLFLEPSVISRVRTILAEAEDPETLEPKRAAAILEARIRQDNQPVPENLTSRFVTERSRIRVLLGGKVTKEGVQRLIDRLQTQRAGQVIGGKVLNSLFPTMSSAASQGNGHASQSVSPSFRQEVLHAASLLLKESGSVERAVEAVQLVHNLVETAKATRNL